MGLAIRVMTIEPCLSSATVLMGFKGILSLNLANPKRHIDDLGFEPVHLSMEFLLTEILQTLR